MNRTTINFQLVESLIQAIHALSPDEQNLVRSRLFSTETHQSHQSIGVLPEKTRSPQQPILGFLEAIHQQGPFRTPEEIDHDIQMEKDAWDS